MLCALRIRFTLGLTSDRSLHQQRHPMSLAVENSLEDWMGLYNSIMKVTLLPYPPLERELPQLRLRCDARDDYLLLVPRRIKMVCHIYALSPIFSLSFTLLCVHLALQNTAFIDCCRYCSSCLRCECSSNCFKHVALWVQSETLHRTRLFR